MKKKSLLERIRIKIIKYNYQYYILNNPIISDEEYDIIFRKLIILENKYPNLMHINSPTNRIGSISNSKFFKVSHNIPMLSLKNVCSKKKSFRIL